MALSIGQVVAPRRRFVGRLSTYTTSATGRRVYDADVLYDARGRRTTFARVVQSMGDELLTSSFFNRDDAATARRIHWNESPWAASTAYLLDSFVVANDKLWRCTVPGTSDSVGSGPSGSGAVTDGSVTWVEVLGPDSDAITGAPHAAAQSATVYEVLAYDIDAKGYVTDYYPETELLTLTSYADFLEAGTNVGDPTNVLPYVAAGHVDLAAPPQSVADLARVYELTGIDPRS